MLISLLLLAGALLAPFITPKTGDDLPGGGASVTFEEGSPSLPTVEAAENPVPAFSGEPQIKLNGNRPNFTAWDLEHLAGEQYAPLDELGRCGSASARLSREMMPESGRGEIGTVTPSGWNQKKYPEVIDSQPPYLYNRCHLIAHALTGQDANERNLITGTRYLNTELMLPWEVTVARYLDHSDDQVLYRVTPYFAGNELVPRGLEMEALSVGDGGRGICFHVFLYNIQPGVAINYADGSSYQTEPPA